MNFVRTWLGLLAVTGLFSGCASIDGAGGGGTVNVEYQDPENFTDMKRNDVVARGADEGYLRELQRYIERVGRNRVPEGRVVALTITDVDMAGDFEPQRGPEFNDVRIVKSIYPPRINLAFRVTDPAGNLIVEGERQLRDLSFNWRTSPVDQDDPLRHEKALIDDFFRELARL